MLKVSQILKGNISEYRIIAQIGRGGMGAVYKAEDLRNGNIIAIKELDPASFGPDAQEAIDWFKREAGILERLDHPHIPKFYEHFTHNNSYYTIMDFLEGEDLKSLLDRNSRGLDELTIIQWGIELCDILSYLHANNIIYRDIKPHNIMRLKSNQVVLIDFGIARFLSYQRTGTKIGTEGYSAPEQYHGKAVPASDVYSLGATLHYLLTRQEPKIPFNFPPLRKLNPNLHPDIERVVMKALEYKQEDRIKTARKMRMELKRVLTKISLNCPVCNEANRLTAKYCGNCGSLLRPLEFTASGNKAFSLDELVKIADRNWEEAKGKLYSGDLERWLRGINEDRLANKASKIVSHQSDRDAGLEELLQATGLVQHPRLRVDTLSLNLGSVDLGDEAEREIEIFNEGRGYLTGEVITFANWLRATPRSFRGNRNRIKIRARTDSLKAGNSYQRALRISANGTTKTASVSLKINPIVVKRGYQALIGAILGLAIFGGLSIFAELLPRELSPLEIEKLFEGVNLLKILLALFIGLIISTGLSISRHGLWRGIVITGIILALTIGGYNLGRTLHPPSLGGIMGAGGALLIIAVVSAILNREIISAIAPLLVSFIVILSSIDARAFILTGVIGGAAIGWYVDRSSSNSFNWLAMKGLSLGALLGSFSWAIINQGEKPEWMIGILLLNFVLTFLALRSLIFNANGYGILSKITSSLLSLFTNRGKNLAGRISTSSVGLIVGIGAGLPSYLILSNIAISLLIIISSTATGWLIGFAISRRTDGAYLKDWVKLLGWLIGCALLSAVLGGSVWMLGGAILGTIGGFSNLGELIYHLPGFSKLTLPLGQIIGFCLGGAILGIMIGAIIGAFASLSALLCWTSNAECDLKLPSHRIWRKLFNNITQLKAPLPLISLGLISLSLALGFILTSLVFQKVIATPKAIEGSVLYNTFIFNIPKLTTSWFIIGGILGAAIAYGISLTRRGRLSLGKTDKAFLGISVLASIIGFLLGGLVGRTLGALYFILGWQVERFGLSLPFILPPLYKGSQRIVEWMVIGSAIGGLGNLSYKLAQNWAGGKSTVRWRIVPPLQFSSPAGRRVLKAIAVVLPLVLLATAGWWFFYQRPINSAIAPLDNISIKEEVSPQLEEDNNSSEDEEEMEGEQFISTDFILKSNG